MAKKTSNKKIAENVNFYVWQINGSIFIAPKYSTLDQNGLPTGGRWECSKAHWQLYRQTAYSNFTDI